MTFAVLLVYPGLVLIIFLAYMVNSLAHRKTVSLNNDVDIPLQRKRVIIICITAILIIAVAYIVTTSLWRYEWLFYAAIFLIFPYVGALYRLKHKNAKSFVIILAVVISFFSILFLGDLSDPETVTIINGFRSTDFSENIAAKLGIFGASAVLLYGEEAFLSKVIFLLCASKKRK